MRGRVAPRTRPARVVYRRRRAAAAALLVALGLAGWAIAGVATGDRTSTAARGRAPRVALETSRSRPAPGGVALPGRRGAAGPPAVEAGLYPWHLPNPISREVLLPSSAPGEVLIAGGLASDGSSDTGVYQLSTSDGALNLLASLPEATHDAAGALLGGSLVVFGGGQATPSAATQDVRGAGAELLGSLPAARADAEAVTVGGVVYVVGGYDGSAMDAAVLATVDGRSYRSVARLPVPVRYPAVAALGASLYVLGGQDAAGQAVDTIQMVDVRTGSARIVGRLPEALSGAAAGDLGGTIYLAGGVAGSTKPVPSAAVLAVEPGGRILPAGRLPVALAYAGATVAGGQLVLVGGELAGGALTGAVQFVRPDRAFGVAGDAGAGSPYFGDRLLVADRGNNRLLVLDDSGRIDWQYPSPSMPPPPGGFYFPDDAFFVDHGREIIVNQEDNETVVELAFPSGKVLWQYGHPRAPGSAPGYLDNPDDAYLLRNGDVSLADTKNCRVLVVDPATKTVLHQIGTVGGCTHNPPSELGSPNGATPLADGNLLVSEINGSWIDEYTITGHLVWATQLAGVAYPSDPQPLGGGRYLVVDYSQPGAIVEFDQTGKVLYRYSVASGPGELDQPSLGALVPSGVFLLNDDYNDRMVAIDPSTGALVWQYGQTGVPGASPGMLSIPDGYDLLGPGGTTPTHPATG